MQKEGWLTMISLVYFTLTSYVMLKGTDVFYIKRALSIYVILNGLRYVSY